VPFHFQPAGHDINTLDHQLDNSDVLNRVNPDEPVRQQDLNSAVEGLAWKDSCRVASQANLNLSSPGASIDGITVVAGERVLVKAQTLDSENGIYIWNGAGVAMTRSLDANTSEELEQAITTVEEGTSIGMSWRQSVVNFVLGTGSVTWIQFGATVGAASETSSGIAELATQAETDAGTDDLRVVTPLKLNTWSNKTRRAQATIGDGSSTQIDVNHNFATRDVIVQVYQASGSYEQVNCDVSLPCPAQTGSLNAHRHRLAQHFQQNHRPALGISRLKNGLDASKRTIGHNNLFSSFKKPLRLAHLLPRAKKFDQFGINHRWLTTKPDQLTHPQGRADRRPTWP